MKNLKTLAAVFLSGILLLTVACSTSEPAPTPPTAVTASASDITTTGFTLTFSAAMPDFSAADIALDKSATISSVTAVEGTESKVYTVVTSTLTAGTAYSITLTKSNFAFTPNPLVLTIPNPTDVKAIATVSKPSTTGFTITFSEAIVGFAKENITLSPAATITSVTADATNKIFTVAVPLTAGTTYSITFVKTGFSITPQPLNIAVPKADVAVKATISNPALKGFILTFDAPVAGLATTDIAINGATITSATAVGTDNKVFNVVTSALTVGTTYTVAITKTGYTFSGTLTFVAAKSTLADLASLKLGAEGYAIAIPAADGTTTLANAPRTIQAAAATLKIVAAIPPGATMSPADLSNVDFSAGKTVTITVTAEDGTTVKNYKFIITAYDATANPYGIYNPRHLSDMRNGMAATDSYKLMNDITLPNMTGYNDATDPEGMGISDYSTSGWKPVGYRQDQTSTGGFPFAGSLDGNKHIIFDLKITTNTNRDIDYGLFGFTATSGVIKNIGLENVNLNTNGGLTAGALVGYNYATISNAYSKGLIKGASTGGLIGDNSGAISSCFSTASITTNYYDGLLGGLIGKNNTSTITNCYATGSSTGEYSGGLIGMGNGIFVNCYATGAISGSITGGILGINSGPASTYTSSYWDKETTGQTVIVSGGSTTNGITTAEMKAGTPYDNTWTAANWTFTAGQYPKLVGVGGQN